MPARYSGAMDEVLHTAARTISAEALLIARIAAGDEQRAIQAIARALRDPSSVQRLPRRPPQQALH